MTRNQQVRGLEALQWGLEGERGSLYLDINSAAKFGVLYHCSPWVSAALSNPTACTSWSWSHPASQCQWKPYLLEPGGSLHLFQHPFARLYLCCQRYRNTSYASASKVLSKPKCQYAKIKRGSTACVCM